MSVLTGLLVGLAVAQGVAPAAPTPTTVEVVLGVLTVQAGDGGRNMLKVVAQDGLLHVSDKVPMTAGAGCQQATGTSVTCPASDISSLSFMLGDGNDTADLDVAFPTSGDGGPGDDTMNGGSAGDTLSGGADHDMIHGNDGADTLAGGAGEDILYGGAGDDFLQGGPDDEVPNEDSPVGEPDCIADRRLCEDKLYGQSDNDYLAGGGSGDALSGGSGTDTLDEPTSGSNRLSGGQGDDTIIGAGTDMRDMAMYDEYTRDVWVNLADVPYEGLAAGHAWELRGTVVVELDTITNVQDIATGKGDDILIGAGGDPMLHPGEGVNLCDFNGNDGVVLTPCT